MIVDDEPIVTKALSSLIPWSSYGFSLIGVANNGKKALDMMEHDIPDLILLDCKMPIMDGITLLENMRERQYDTRTIILSGYDEFQYVQQALKLGASDYFLKPPDIEKLFETCKTLQIEFQQERLLQQQLKENLPVIIERFCHSLIEGNKRSETELLEKLDYLQLPLNSGTFQLYLIEALDSEQYYTHYSYFDQQLLQFSIRNIIEETLQHIDNKVIFQDFAQRFVFICCSEQLENYQSIKQLLEQVITNIKLTLKISTTIGVSRIHPYLHEDSRIAYEEAKLGIEYKYYAGLNEIISIDELDQNYSKPNQNQSKQQLLQVKDLERALKIGDNQLLDEWAQQFIQRVKENQLAQQDATMLSLQAMIESARTVIDIYPQLKVDHFISSENMNAVLLAATLDKLEIILLDFFKRLLSVSGQIRKLDKNVAIERTKKYISANYDQELTLESIANEIHLAPAYLSYLFKQVEMVNIVDYLTSIRLEKAKNLLQNTNMKANEISVKVGYLDNKYFSRIFKKKIGLTPLEYRQRFQKE